MKAWAATGDDRVIAPVEIAEPIPAAHEAVLEVEAYSVDRGDWFALTGVYGEPSAAGTIPGQDVAGRVVAAATDGTGPAVGERVVAHAPGGGWAERVAVPTTAIAARPPRIPATVAATLPLAGLTALRLLRRTGDLRGRRLLITGASGGVGHLVVELAVAAGADVTAVTATAERGQRLAEFGARIVHDLTTAAGPFDVVLESVGGDTFTAALDRLAPGSTIVWFGQASREPVRLDFFRLFAATPVTVHHFAHWISDTTDAADLTELVDLVGTGALHPELGRVADWADTPTVLTDLAARRIRGNAVLTR
ncbi:zinc-binding dehydrogenase [Nocardia sp. alder85J]|uniref:zinc-binding dehydrogenase n=1 Tax=Nocardia sp. alder85J TaxID=2862949 RepID=UPI001CD795F9|nr:zinc-binding dehydrogenase [Nocardia sp. alder85J]MCX4095381.1 zinc-binding dehydrogenase [Nocardia sp. alder85J]